MGNSQESILNNPGEYFVVEMIKYRRKSKEDESTRQEVARAWSSMKKPSEARS